MFSLTVISPTEILPGETQLVCELFESGLQNFHLRKKNVSEMEVINYLDSIPLKHHSKIVLHSHFNLNANYLLKGIHSEVQWAKPDQTKSLSVHNFEEYFSADESIDYVFLSPIYDSISKTNYPSQFNENEISHFFDLKTFHPYDIDVIALGGVAQNNIEVLKNFGFEGAALLGAVWSQPENAVSNFIEVQKKC